MQEATVGEGSRMLPAVRAGIGLLFVLALANGGFLYLFPSQANADYAWAIAPAVSAAFMGAGYLAGAVGTGLALGARSWEAVRALVPGFCALGLASFVTTLVHSEKFRWDYAPTWLWTAVYAALPIVAVGLVILQGRSASSSEPERDPLVRRLAPSFLAGSVLLLAAGVALLIAPTGFLGDWPWKLTPLLSRVFGSWYLLAGITLGVLGLRARRPFELPIPLLTLAAWCALLLLLPVLYPGPVEGGGLLTGFLLFHAGILVMAVLGSAVALRGR